MKYPDIQTADPATTFMDEARNQNREITHFSEDTFKSANRRDDIFRWNPSLNGMEFVSDNLTAFCSRFKLDEA